MSSYNFKDSDEELVDTKKGYRDQLTTRSASIISQATVIKNEFDALRPLLNPAKQTQIDAVWAAFILDLQTTLGV